MNPLPARTNGQDAGRIDGRILGRIVVLFAALISGLFSGPGIALAAPALSGRWQLDIQDHEHRTRASLSVRFSDEKALSCMSSPGGTQPWQELVIESRSTQDERFFPAAGALAFVLNGQQLSIGRVETCDAYLLMEGPLSAAGATGRYSGIGENGATELGYFRLRKAR